MPLSSLMVGYVDFGESLSSLMVGLCRLWRVKVDGKSTSSLTHVQPLIQDRRTREGVVPAEIVLVS